MPYSNRVLVIDDRPEDGEAVARRLWEDQVACCFVKFDENIIQKSFEKTFTGIRVIFQDIKLIEGGIPDHSDYGSAAQLLSNLLDDNNGPWLLVAWSTWSEDPDEGHRYAEELFDYLVSRLPEGKRPYKFLVFDKKAYTVDHNHGVVKNENELEDKEKEEFLAQIKSYFGLSPSINSVSQWERNVINCASHVVKTLWQMTEGLTGNREDELEGLLLKLAKAQDARISDDVSKPLYDIMASLLSDRLNYLTPGPIALNNNYTGGINDINTMLHWDGVHRENTYTPGSVYKYPIHDKVAKYFVVPDIFTIREFIVSNFIANNGDKGKSVDNANRDNNFSKNISPVLLDITPPCDHDNNKAIWRKMILGVRVEDNDTTKKYLKHIRHEASLKQTPVFTDGDKVFFFIFNSNLVTSVPDQNTVLKDLVFLGRVREQLLRDYVSWVGGMVMRPGIVSVTSHA